MRLLQCLTHASLGGGQEVVFTLVRLLLEIRPEWTVAVSLPPDGPYVQRFRDLGVEVHSGPWNRLSPAGLLDYHRHVLKFRPDVVHSHGKGAGVYARFLRDRCRHVHSYHGFHPPLGRVAGDLYRRLEVTLLRNTQAVVAVSEAEADELRTAFARSRTRIFAIPNVIDPGGVQKRAGHRLPERVLEFLHRVPHTLVVTMIARADPAKDYPLALAAAEIALAREPRLSFAFVGPGETAEIMRLKEKFPGRIFTSAPFAPVAGLIAASAVVLLTSKKEGGRPLVIQEAFALGKPVVATDVPGIRETVEAGVNGFLCAPNPESIADRIVQLVTSPDLLRKCGANALKTAQKSSVRAWAEQYTRVYELYTVD